MQLSSFLAIAPHVLSTVGLIVISLTALLEEIHKSNGGSWHSAIARGHRLEPDLLQYKFLAACTRKMVQIVL